MDPGQIKTLIDSGLPDSIVSVVSDDNTHYATTVVSEAFSGKRQIARHQLVYRCLGDLMGNEIHAMSIRTYTPDEWKALADNSDNFAG